MLIYNLLFQAATETLQEFADRRWHGSLGITCVLHTRGQQPEQHIHLHCVVTGGGLTYDKQRWINAQHNYLFKVENPGTAYRGKFCNKLLKASGRGEITNPPDSLIAKDRESLQDFIDHLHTKPWVVYSKARSRGRRRC